MQKETMTFHNLFLGVVVEAQFYVVELCALECLSLLVSSEVNTSILLQGCKD